MQAGPHEESDEDDVWTLARLLDLGPARRRRLGLAFLIASLGAVLFVYLKLPLPIFLGALTFCMAASILDWPIERPTMLSAPMRMVLGVAVGSAFSPALIAALPGMALSLAVLVPFTILITFAGTMFFERVAGYPRPTAFFSAVPGGLTDMVTMGGEAGASPRTVTLIHATRIAFLVFTIPFCLELAAGTSIGGRLPSLVHVWDMRLLDAVVLVAIAIGGWQLAERAGITGAPLFGPMIASGGLHALGVTAAKVPFEVLVLAQLTLGILLGCQFRGLTLGELRAPMVWAVVFSAALLAVTLAVAGLVSALTGLDRNTLLLAYAPGGQNELNLLALILNVDVAFVALHHLVRLAIVIIGAQMIFAASPEWRRRGGDPPPI
jgi:hypothetical protein